MGWDKKVPFANGNMLRYYDSFEERMAQRNGHTVEWVDANVLLNRKLTYKGFGRGRSAAYFEFEDESRKKFYMFMRDLNDLLIHGKFEGSSVEGTWRLVKRGANFGIAYADFKE